MAKGIENRARSPPAVFYFATSQIQKHGGTKMYYDLVESGKRIKALRKKHGLTQEQLAEQLGVAANTIARIETGNRGIATIAVKGSALIFCFGGQRVWIESLWTSITSI